MFKTLREKVRGCFIESGTPQQEPGTAPAATVTEKAPDKKLDAPSKEKEKGSSMPKAKAKKAKISSKKKEKSSSKKSQVKKPAAPKVAVKYPSTAKKCPYREGSMKAKAYGVFAKGGTRGEMIATIQKLGATENTASSWIQFFRKFVKTGKK